MSQVELSTERGRAALLYDSTSQPLAKLEAGQRHDFAVKHDVKELVGLRDEGTRAGLAGLGGGWALEQAQGRRGSATIML